MLIDKSEITIMVQGQDITEGPGPLTADIVQNYEDQGYVVVRGNSTEAPAPHIYNQQNIWRQCMSTIAGLELVTTPYVMKCRSDIWIKSAEPFREGLSVFPDRYVCSNLHFRPDRTFKFHPSDKFIIGNTQNILAMFRDAKSRCENQAILLQSGIYEPDGGVFEWATPETLTTRHTDEPKIGAACLLPWGYIGTYPEVVLGTSWLNIKGIGVDRKTSRATVKDNFAIVQVEKCGGYLNKLGSSHPEHNWVEIHDIWDF